MESYDKEWNALALRLMHTKSKKKRNQLKKRYPWLSSTSIPMVIKKINPKLSPIINEILNQNMKISPFDSIEKYYADQKALYQYVFENLTLQSRYDDGNSNIAPTKTTVNHNSTDISIRTIPSELENSHSLIASNHNAWVDINLGKGITAFAYNTGAGSDISEKIYYDGKYNINGKPYKAVNIQSMKHNNQREWDLLRQSKPNQAYLISQDKSDMNKDNILLLEKA